MIDEWDLTATNLHRIRKRNYQVAVLPTAAIEPHNLHLPQGQDFRHTTYVSRRCSQAAFEKTPSVLCLPAIPYGVDCNLSAFPFAVHVSQTTLDAMVRDVITSLHSQGLRKFVIINGHGGNDFAPLIRQIQCDLDVYVFLCNWWTVGHDRYDEFFSAPEDHAGQMETSLALALFEDLVEPGVAGDGVAREFRFEALRKGWLRTSRDFSKLNDHCAVGDPSDASAEKGNAYLDLVCGRITEFLVELADSEIDEHFPQMP